MVKWSQPLLLAFAVQVVTSAADMTLPVLAPAITAAAGVPPEWVGYYASAVAAGAVIFYLLGAGLVHRAGPLRSLQLGVVVCALALLLILLKTWWLILAAGLLIGLGFGTNAPASGVLLRNAVPDARRNLAFSIKQTGMPLGAMLAGLCLPWLAVVWGWQGAVLAAASTGIVVLLLLQPFRTAFDTAEGGDTGPLIDLPALTKAASSPIQRRFAAAGLLLAIAQGSLNAFLVTYLVQALGYSLALAGGLYALAQLVGIPGRIAAGWLADGPLQGSRTLAAIAVAISAGALVVSSFDTATPLPAVAAGLAALGLVVGSWNGVMLAGVAKAAPATGVVEATNFVSIGTFAGFVLGPPAFGLIVSLSGGYWPALLFVACVALAALAALPWSSANPRAAAG